MSQITQFLQQQFEDKRDLLEAWLAAQREAARPFLTTSVDLRHNGERLVPVDTNLFPAGFHNLSDAGRRRAIQHFQQSLSHCFPEAKRILLLPEQHTRNAAYHNNVLTLVHLFSAAGYEVDVGILDEKAEPIVFNSSSGATIEQQHVTRKDGMLYTEKGGKSDLVVVNNDLTSGAPELLSGLKQPVMPPPGMGWYQRRKSQHFHAYAALAGALAKELAFDPWLISAYFTCAELVDFKHREGLDAVARAVDAVLEKARAKHLEYGIAKDPYVFVKADRGTYGMGIMTVYSGEEVLAVNKKLRNKMHVIKEGALVNDVIIQEGIPSIDTVEGAPAEPSIYLVDGVPVGGMYRVNASRDSETNLNAAGMHFVGMCDADESADTARHPVEGCDFEALGLIATLAALAAPRERELMAHDCPARVA